MSHRIAIASNTFSQLLGKLVTMGVTMVVTAIVTRSLGESGYGQFTLIMGYSALFYILADFGLNAIATRDLSINQNKESAYLTSLVFLRTILSLTLFLLGVVILYFLPYTQLVKIGIVLSLITVLTTALYTSFNALFQVHLHYHKAALSASAASLLLLGWTVMVSLTVKDEPLLYYVSGYVLHGIVMVGLSYFMVLSYVKGMSPSLDRRLTKQLFIASLPLGLMLIFAQIHGKTDIMLLSLWRLPGNVTLTRDETLGIYGLAYKIFEVVLVFATFFMNAAFPVLVQKAKIGRYDLHRSFRQVVYFLFGAGILGFLGLYLVAPTVVNVLAGPEFVHSIVTLRLLSIGLPAFFVSSAMQWYLVTVNRQNVLPVIYLIGAVTTVLLNLWLIPRFSYAAPAILTWVVEYFILVMMALYTAIVWRKSAQ